MVHAGDQKHSREAARRIEAADGLSESLIVVRQPECTRRRIGESLPQNQFAAGIAESAKIGVSGVVYGTVADGSIREKLFKSKRQVFTEASALRVP